MRLNLVSNARTDCQYALAIRPMPSAHNAAEPRTECSQLCTLMPMSVGRKADGIEIITRTACTHADEARADCQYAPAVRPIHASAELVCTAVSQHAAFENPRRLESPCGSDASHAGPSGRAAALIVEAQAAPLELGDGMLWEPCPVSARPCPCRILARARLPFRLAAMASSAYIASSQAAPAMPAAASGAPPNARAICACARISLFSSFYRRYR
jgi:hypothetical protein